MPVDRTHRRTSGDDAHSSAHNAAKQREQELRRARGEIACVECQRLKLRCDRKVPCSSCIRRNRAAMCPNGHAWSDQETRSLLSDTAQLHRKLSEMSQRIRQLEDALEISHSANSASAHPLLREELLAIKRGISIGKGIGAGPSNPISEEGGAAGMGNEKGKGKGGDGEGEGDAGEEGEGEFVDAMGTMSISDRGVSRFIGRSGGTESLLLLGNDGLPPPVSRKPTFDSFFPQFLSDAWLFIPSSSTSHCSPYAPNPAFPSQTSTFPFDSEYSQTFPSQSPQYTPFEASSQPFSPPPFTPASRERTLLSIIDHHMPSFERATSLCETYLENFSWILRIVERQQLLSELLPCYYRNYIASKQNSTSSFNGNGSGNGNGLNSTQDTASNLSGNVNQDPSTSTTSNSTTDSTPSNPPGPNPHELSLLLMVFSTGALADLTLPPYNDESEKYYQLARASLSITQVLGSPSLAAVQAIALMGIYNAHSGRTTFALDLAGSLMGLAGTLGVSMGLHRDCEKWKVAQNVVERRRFIFWELFTTDCWHNLANGKPPTFALRYCDCKFPEDKEKKVHPDGRTEKSYYRFRHEFSRDLVYVIGDLYSGVKPVRYSQVLELDRKITEHPPPAHLRIPAEGSSMENDGPMLIMQRLVPVVCRDGLLMYIHRGFFAKALLENPTNPLSSPYAHSYLAAYRSALGMLKVIREHYASFPNLLCRFWSLWSHAFSATVIIGSIVIKGRSSDTARAALIELNLAVGLFEKASLLSERAKRSLPTLIRLREKAHNSAKFLNEIPSTLSSASGLRNGGNGNGGGGDADADGEVEDEILILGGKTKLVEQGHALTRGHSTSSRSHSHGQHVYGSGNELGLGQSKPSTPTVSTPTSGPMSRSQTLVPDTQAVYQALQSVTSSSTPSTATATSISQQLDLNMSDMSNMPDALNLLPTLPPPPRPEDIPMNHAMATAFEHTSLPSAWSDQEALLIKYLSSGVDLNVAQSSAFAQASDPDPAAFMWADMSYSNSPDSQPSMDGTGSSGSGYSQQQQQQDGLGNKGDVIRSHAATPLNNTRSQAQTPYSVATNLNLDLDPNAAFPLFSMNGPTSGYSGVPVQPQQQQHLNQQQQQQQTQQPYSVPVQLGGLSWNSQWGDQQVFFP